MTQRKRRLRGQSLRILLLLNDAPQEEPLYAGRITSLTGLQSSTVFPILSRFLDLGWVEDEKEKGTALDLGRPPRRYYRITSEGRAQLNEVTLNEVREVKTPAPPVVGDIVIQMWTGSDENGMVWPVPSGWTITLNKKFIWKVWTLYDTWPLSFNEPYFVLSANAGSSTVFRERQ
jgi:DNA-binding PadR family transcriptional regulator